MLIQGFSKGTPCPYSISYNVYRLNKLANLKLFQELLRVRISLKYLIVSEFQKKFRYYKILFLK